MQLKQTSVAKIARPTDDYDPMWTLYNAQNPNRLRAVGADAVDDNSGEAGGEGGDGTADGSPGDEGKGKEPPKGDEKPGEEDKSKGDDKSKELLKEVMEKKGTIKDLKSEVSDLKGQLAKFDGVDLDEVKALLKEREDAETKKLEDKGEWDKLKGQMAEQHQKDIEAKDGEISNLQAQLTKQASVIENLTVGHAFDNSDYIRDGLTLTPAKARVIYGDHFDVQEDGSVVGYDKPRGKEGRTQFIDGAGEPLAFAEALTKLVEADPDKDHLIKSTLKKGADSKPASGKAKDTVELKGLSRIEAGLAKQKKGSK
jgi:hypothetical protein